MANAEGGATLLVVVLLIVAAAVVAKDVVHRDVERLTVGSDMADEVHRRMRAGVVEHLETLECDALLSLAGSKGDAVMLARPCGEGTAQQYNRHSGMD